MDSSSEGSFAWTDASDDTTDNENMAKSKLNVGQSGEESESGEGYKKELRQRLFGERAPAESPARKRALEPDQPHAKRIKLEPESDVDSSKKKRNKVSQFSDPHSTSKCYDESFLDSKVKSEQSFTVPAVVKAKKKKKKSVFDGDFITTNNGVDTSSDSQLLPDVNGVLERGGGEGAGAADSSQEQHQNQYDSYTKKKKKKKKSRQRSPSLETKELEENVCAPNGTQAENTVDETQAYASATEQAESQPAPASPMDTGGEYAAFNGDHTPRAGGHSQSLIEKRKSKMSERIQFEDDEEDSGVLMKNLSASKQSAGSGESKLRSYMGSHGYLRRAGAGAPPPGADDDVWLVSVPRAVPAAALRGARLALSAHCKLKLAGHTYEGAASAAAPAVLAAPGARLGRLTLAGRLRLQRRLPKPQVGEGAAAPARRADFIPLPDTKCRHPLLGAHYKKALKLPAAAAARLAAPARAEPELAPKKKKKKRKRSERADDGASPRAASPRAASPRAWDSEKAIEQNLFNF